MGGESERKENQAKKTPEVKKAEKHLIVTIIPPSLDSFISSF
jgi:hypothetical protein